MNGYYKILVEILKRYGAYYVRPAKGDHEVWKRGNLQTTVDKGCNSRHTANAVLKQLQIPERIK